MTRGLSLRTCKAVGPTGDSSHWARWPFHPLLKESLGLGRTEPFQEETSLKEKVTELTLRFVWLRSGDRGLHTFCKNEKAQFQGSEFVVGDCSSIWENIFHICHKKFKMSEDSHRRPQDPQPP